MNHHYSNQQQQLVTSPKSNQTKSIYMQQLANPMKVPMTATITAPTATPIISVSIVIILFILMAGYVSHVILTSHRFDCDTNNEFQSKFGEPLSLLPTTTPPHTIVNKNRNIYNTEIGALYEFVIAILLISNINVYFTTFDILFQTQCVTIISTIIVIFLLCAQIIASDLSSARKTFNDIFGLPTMNMSCGGILYTFTII